MISPSLKSNLGIKGKIFVENYLKKKFINLEKILKSTLKDKYASYDILDKDVFY